MFWAQTPRNTVCLCTRVLLHCRASDFHVCCLTFRFPNAFALNSTHSMVTSGSAAEGDSSSSPVDTDTLKIEEVQPPATGTRKAKVLYDYDAADSSELSLLADEVSRLKKVNLVKTFCWKPLRSKCEH